MSARALSELETEVPSAAEAEMARASSLVLARQRTGRGALSLTLPDDQAVRLDLPAPAVRLLLQGLQELGQGHAVRLLPQAVELTTQQAAEMLGVSRPFL